MTYTAVLGPLDFTGGAGTTTTALYGSLSAFDNSSRASYMGTDGTKCVNLFSTADPTYVRANTGTYAGDQYAKATTGGWSGGGGSRWVALIVQSSADVDASADYYALTIDNATPKTTKIDKVVNGSATTVAGPSTSIAWADGDVALLEIVGGVLTAFKNGTTTGLTYTDGSPLTGGRPGFGHRDSAGGPVLTLDDVELGSVTAAGTPAGLATETDTALALAAKQIKATGLATETDTALALTTSAGFDFHTGAGLIFGDLAGALTSLAREAAVSMVLRVYAVASPGALVVESGTLTTDSNGRLARYTHASLAAATSYHCMFIRASDGEIVSAKLTAT